MPRRLGSLRRFIAESLEALYPPGEAASLAYRILEERLGLSRSHFLTWPEQEADAESLKHLATDLAMMLEGIPLQYVTGTAHFMDLAFHVDENVLIPRPETEELARWVAEDFADHPESLRILDIGTGSGCIIISLACMLKHPPFAAGLDISEGALRVARRNAGKHGVEVRFEMVDIITASGLDRCFGGPFDIIVSNPPYVTEEEKAFMHANVLAHEPRIALFAPAEDPDVFYRVIARKAAAGLLKPGGSLYFELNESRAAAVTAICRSAGFRHIEVRSDLPGKERMMRSRFQAAEAPTHSP